MLIGIDASRTMVKQRTGTEVYSLNLIHELLRLDPAHGFRLYFREAPSSDLGLSSAGVEQRVINMPRLWTHLGLSWEVMRASPDVLFIPAHVAPALRRCPTVVTVHDLGYLYYPQAYTRLRWWSLHLSTQFSARMATLLLADSEATKADLVGRYGVDPGKVRVVYLGRDASLAPVTSAARLDQVRAKYGIEGDYFLYLGTLQPRKNVAGLLRAFAAFKSKAQTASSCKLVLAGRKGWLYDSIHRAAQNSGLGQEVIFTDYVPDDDLPALLTGAIALVFPSFYEGFGFPALQAMACGTPVIASNVSSLPEVVGEAGLLVDPHSDEQIAEAMARVSVDVGLRAELSRRGLRRAEQFSWEKCAVETLQVLEEAAQLRQLARS